MTQLFEEILTRTLNGDKAKSDQAIYNEARKEWTAVLLQLWEAYNKAPDPKQLKVYIRQLSDVPLAVLEDTVATLLREHKFNSVPTLGEVWEVIKTKHGDQSQISARQTDWLFDFTDGVGYQEYLERDGEICE